MYHIGLVQYTILPKEKGMVSADNSTQAVVRMWDKNLLILLVDKNIGKKVNIGDYVLCDYTPMSPTSKHRKLYITKILPKAEGKKIWEDFLKEHQRRSATVKEKPGPTQVRYIR